MSRMLLALAVIFTLAACGGSTPSPTPTPEPTATPSPVIVSGTFDLKGRDSPNIVGIRNGKVGSPCDGFGGYDDITPGMEVKVAASSIVLAVGRFGPGQFTRYEQSSSGNVLWTCTFGFSMSVPPGHDFYTVTVARRGERNYNKTPPYLRQTWETDGFNQLLKNSMEWGLGSEK